ncbi:MAG: response regulator [Paludibacter sp.]|nr:response regulator [Paludibacter sp.]
MLSGLHKKNVIFLFFLSFCFSILAQSGNYFTPDNVLSNSLVNAIYQDKRGYIWIATEDGLNKYDGVRFTSYRTNKNDEFSLINNYVRTVFEDSKGRFWVGCISGLMLYDRAYDTFTEVPVYFRNQKVTPHITSIIETIDGEIWISTSGTGIIRSKNNYKSFSVDETLFPHLCSRYLMALYQDKKGQIWIASENQGINLYQPKSGKIQDFKAPAEIGSNHISAITEDNDGSIFVGTLTGGLYRYNQFQRKFDKIPFAPSALQLPIKSLLFDNSGRLLVGTDGRGVKFFNKTTGMLENEQMLSSQFDFSRTKVHAFCQDKSGNLWLGLFQKGVIILPNHPNKFQYWGAKSFQNNIIGANCVMSVSKDASGVLWVGTDNDGMYGISGNKSYHFELKNKQNGVSATIMAILEGDNSNLWLGSYTDGLIRFNKISGAYNSFLHELPNSHKNASVNKVMCLAKDAKNRIWTGTNGSGVQIFDIQTSKFSREFLFHEEDSSGIANNWVNCLLNDGDSMMWVGTYEGVSCIHFQKNEIKTFRAKSGIIAGNIVLSIIRDNQGLLWFGTTEGLSCYNPYKKTTQHYTIKNGLPGNVICGILEDGKGDLWLSTHNGISNFLVAEKRFVNYNGHDGLQGNEFTNGAACQAVSGELIFGGTGGVTAFLPSQISEQQAPVLITLTGLYLFDKRVVKDQKSGFRTIIDDYISDVKKIRLNYKDNMFSLEFSTFDFGRSGRIYYKYKMSGLNDQWIKTETGVNRISFTNMSYGSYKLQVKACVNDKESEIKVVEIEIYPPWYLSWLAKLIYVLLFAFIGWIVYRFVIERINNRHELMRREHLEQINEGKLQFFINISHEIRTPMSLIISPLEKLISENKNSEKQAVYQLMYRNAQRILRLINQLLDVRKIDKGQMFVKMRRADLVFFIDDLMKTFEYQAKKRKVDFNFEHDSNELFAWIDVNNFDKVLVNILSNAFKFTPEKGKISVKLTTGSNENAATQALRNYVEISVTDTGIGIEADKIERIFERFYQIDNSQTQVNFGTGIGLHLAKNLVELMHGQIIAENNPNQNGSRFSIQLPLGDEHLPDSEREYLNDSTIRNNRVLTTENYELQDDNQPLKQSIRSKSRQRLLIVDDEEEIRNYLKDEFAGRYRVYEAENGKQALDFILTEKPDLVISDVMMPEMDGISLCKKLKSNININHIPIILLTAKSADEDKAEGFDIGADAYVAKPFNIELLKKRVLNILENRARLEHKAMDDEENQALIKQVVLKPNDQILLEKIIKIINENIAVSELNVEMLADGVGMSRVHMHRKLKELTNMSARDFIRSIRLKQAAELLTTNKLTVSEVAYALGFSNLSHFSNSFREFYGLSPKDYTFKHWKGDKID